jgi:hypothetical protein
MSKVKGSLVVSAVKLLRSQRDLALQRLPARLHHYLQEPISVSAWYPELDQTELVRVCATLRGESSDEGLRMLGAAVAREHFEGVYGDLVHRDLRMIMHAVWKTQHDTGQLVVTAESNRSSIYELSGYEFATPEICAITGAYFQELHRIRGAPDAAVTHPACRLAGDELCTWVVRWSCAGPA